jgi:hypothetical protein
MVARREFQNRVSMYVKGEIETVEFPDAGGVRLHLSNAPVDWIEFYASSFGESPVLALRWPVERQREVREAGDGESGDV